MGRKGPRAKTKTVLKPVNKWDKLGSMPNVKCQTFLNKNPPTLSVSYFHILFYKLAYFSDPVVDEYVGVRTPVCSAGSYLCHCFFRQPEIGESVIKVFFSEPPRRILWRLALIWIYIIMYQI